VSESRAGEIGVDEQPDSFVCPLTKVQPGTRCRIKQLLAAPELAHRLRELGFCEEQQIRLLTQERTMICQVCNARLGISAQLAEAILVEPIRGSRKAA
jgi:ferrous iron transport protein A